MRLPQLLQAESEPAIVPRFSLRRIRSLFRRQAVQAFSRFPADAAGEAGRRQVWKSRGECNREPVYEDAPFAGEAEFLAPGRVPVCFRARGALRFCFLAVLLQSFRIRFDRFAWEKE